MNNTIIAGSNNTVSAQGLCGSSQYIGRGITTITGGQNNTVIGTCGYSSIGGATGITGHQGTAGPGGYMTDWKQIIMNKYPRFTIKTEYDVMTFAPTNTIIDNRTNKEYKFQPYMSDIMNETDKYIQRLIIEIREDKINNIINVTKD